MPSDVTCKTSVPARCSAFLSFRLKREMLQDQFLKAIVQTRAPVTIYLMNGIRLLGQVESFDQYGLVLGGASQQFVYKHAISTIVPAGEVTPVRETAAAVPAPPVSMPAPAAAPTEERTAAPQKSTTILRPRIKRTPSPSK
jgi:host factor-I protein